MALELTLLIGQLCLVVSALQAAKDQTPASGFIPVIQWLKLLICDTLDAYSFDWLQVLQ